MERNRLKNQGREITDPAFKSGVQLTVDSCKVLTVSSIEEAPGQLIEGGIEEIVAVTGE